MLDRGKVFLKKLTEARNKVAKITLPYFVDGTVSICILGLLGLIHRH